MHLSAPTNFPPKLTASAGLAMATQVRPEDRTEENLQRTVEATRPLADTFFSHFSEQQVRSGGRVNCQTCAERSGEWRVVRMM